MSRSLYARLHHRFGPKSNPLTRREMLQRTAAATVGLLLSREGAGMLLGALGSGVQQSLRRVVVVGAGFSGLACAYELRSAGYDVIVVEARDRVGGRVLSFNAALGGEFVKGRNIEGGGELIGSNHPTWVAYAQKFRLKWLDVTKDENLDAPIVLGGKRLTAGEAEALYKGMDAALKKMNDDARRINVEAPWKSEHAAELDARSAADWIRKAEVSEMCRQGLVAQFTADNSTSVDRQSYLGILAQVAGGGIERYWTDSEVYRCQGGNQQLAVKLADGIGRDRIALKLPVTRVETEGDHLVVTCSDQRTIEADDVVLAVAPSVWHKLQIEPPLPPALKVTMGANVKYLAALRRRFWKDAKLGPDLLSDGDIQMTWDSTDNQEGDENVCLNSFSGGPAAEKCRSWPKDKRDESYQAALERIYPGFSENFVQSRFMDWPADSWALASYSFPAPGEVTRVGPLLAKGHGRVHFAGEHCCYQFVGYMEGALNSGVTLARRLATRDGAKVGG